jgi:hypothetical protein
MKQSALQCTWKGTPSQADLEPQKGKTDESKMQVIATMFRIHYLLQEEDHHSGWPAASAALRRLSIM